MRGGSEVQRRAWKEKATAETVAEEVLQMVLAVANHRPKGLGTQEGLLPQRVDSGKGARPAMVTSPPGKAG